MFTFATYNILHGYHSDLILESLSSLLGKGVDVICIQEADVPFKSLLTDLIKNKNWEIIYYHNTIACNLAIAWNPAVLIIQDKENIPLPRLSKISLIQRVVDLRKDIQRGALRASFLFNNKLIQITNVHLAWEGGMKHTLLQLTYLKNELEKNKKECEILAGDFNTFTPKMFRRGKEKKVEKVLLSWSLLPNISWTCDTSYTAPQDGATPYANFLNLIGIKMRSRLDYIFSRNLKIISSEMIDLPGSDHRPLIAKFEV